MQEDEPVDAVRLLRQGLDEDTIRNDDVMMGLQIRALRKAKRMSLQQLSDKCGLSVGLISQIERGLSSPSVKALRALVEALGVTVGWLFQHEANSGFENGGVILRKEQRRRLSFNDGDVTKELLTTRHDSELELLVVTVIPGGSSGPSSYTHEGDEGGVVLEGELRLWVEGVMYHLREGDSFGFASTRPHRFENPGSEVATVLWAITPPTF